MSSTTHPERDVGVAQARRPTPGRSSALVGLTTEEVASRRAAGPAAEAPHTSRTVVEILRANVLTRFNAILGSLLVVILFVGPLQDGLFGIVLVANVAIGVVQELRAKRTLDHLALLTTPRARVLRDGVVREVAVEEVVPDDLLEARAGDQFVVDGTVQVSEGLEVDEALLSGEAEPVAKAAGDVVLSGSIAVAGQCWYRATRVGAESYARRLADEARRFSLVRSELGAGIDRILRVVTWAIAPVAVLLISSQLAEHERLADALRGSVAGVGSMIPEGLVLLTSVAFAVSVVRLGRARVLVQELAAVEGLARVDVICLDKTGTLTEARLSLAAVRAVGEGPAEAALGAIAASAPSVNASLQAIAEGVGDPGWTAKAVVPFSSARRWSGAGFAGRGTWVLGAPDVVIGARPGSVAQTVIDDELAAGRRVLVLASTNAPIAADGLHLPEGLAAQAVVSLEEQIRPDAAETLAFFGRQGVTVKVLSGDDPRTVAAVSARVGVRGADRAVDATNLPDAGPELGAALREWTVFGRVAPHHKRAMVAALQADGHVVAMTGDGVNDALALKLADIGVAMRSGSPASRAVAPIVLLDDAFSALPGVVAEGRRVIANVERVANLFVTKTVYALLLALAVGVGRMPFPFYPRHLTIVSSLTIGVPAFFLALAPNSTRASGGFLRRVLEFAVPAGAVAAGATLAGYALARGEPGVTLVQARSTAMLVLFGVAIWVLGILARPFTVPRAVLVAVMVVAFVVIGGIPALRTWFEIDPPPLIVTTAAVGVIAVADGLLELGWRLAVHIGRRGDQDDRPPAG
jgi:cation-transporting ATPase E